MTSLHKTSLALALGVALPALGMAALAHAQEDDFNGNPSYDGYCYERMNDARMDAAIANGDRVSSSGSHSQCYRGQYFSLGASYREPPAPPRGYVTVKFEDRPDQAHFTRVNYNSDPRMLPPPMDRTAWRDDRGFWHDGAPVSYRWHRHTYYDATIAGWRDKAGVWHKAPHRP